MDSHNGKSKVPDYFLYMVIIICVSPFILTLFRVDFSSKNIEAAHTHELINEVSDSPNQIYDLGMERF